MPDKWQARVIQLLAVPGLLVAGYLLLYHNGALVASCKVGGWEDCGLVSGPNGLVGYAAIFLTTWLADWLAIVRRYLPELLLGLTGLALLFTLGLTALEIFVIHAVCRYCLVSAAIVLVMFVLAISYLRAANRAGRALADNRTDDGRRNRLDVA